MSLLEKIISRKSAVAPAAPVAATDELSRSETPAAAPKNFAAEISPVEKISSKLEPCPACGLPASWISVYEISELEDFEAAEFSGDGPGEQVERSSATPAGTPATLDDGPRPAWLRCPECQPAPAVSLVGARVAIVEPRPSVRSLVRCDADWRPESSEAREVRQAKRQAAGAGRATAGTRPDLDDSPASLVELPTGVNGKPVRIWTRQPTGILRRVAWTLASFPE